MFRLKQLAPEGHDCTAPYDVILDTEYTVLEFINTVVSREREWGYIGIDADRSPFGEPCCEYKWGDLLSVLPDDILHKKITKVKASGGWSRMDYRLWIE